MRIATYNVGSLLALGNQESGPFELEPAAFAEKCAGIGRVIDEIAPDLLVLQEVVSEEGIQGVLAAAASGSEFLVLGMGAPGSRGIRTWIVGHRDVAQGARTEARDDGLDVISWNGEPLLRKDSIVHSRLPLGDGGMLHLLGLHLKSKRASGPTGDGPFEPRDATEWAHGALFATTRRMVQAVRIREIVDGILDDDEGAFVCVAGDFNDSPYSPPLEAIRGAHPWLEDAHKKRLLACSTVLPVERRFTYLHYGNQVLLDDLLVSPALWKRRTGVDVPGNADLGSGAAPSDHAPIVADFAI